MKTAEGAQLVHDRLCKGGLYLADIRCPLKVSVRSLTEVVEFGRVFTHVAMSRMARYAKDAEQCTYRHGCRVFLSRGVIVIKLGKEAPKYGFELLTTRF